MTLGLNYDNWLTKPYDDACDEETTVDIVCAEHHEDEEDWSCDYSGEADGYITEESSGRRWWSMTIEGECPKCGASFKVEQGDYDDSEETW